MRHIPYRKFRRKSRILIAREGRYSAVWNRRATSFITGRGTVGTFTENSTSASRGNRPRPTDY